MTVTFQHSQNQIPVLYSHTGPEFNTQFRVGEEEKICLKMNQFSKTAVDLLKTPDTAKVIGEQPSGSWK